MCLSVSASSFLIDAASHLPELRQETGPTLDVAYQKENSLYETYRMKRQVVCFKQRGCSMQILNSPALQVDHEKLKQLQRIDKKKKKEKKEKETKFFYSSERNSSGLCMVAGTQWHQTTDCSTVLISMRAVIESAKFEKKSRKKDTMQHGKKAKKVKKKVLLKLRNKLIRSVHSCRCSVASHK